MQKAVADSMASVTRQISSSIDNRFDKFKKQFKEENSSSAEAAVKRAKRARFVFQSKGNEQQFEHVESVLDKLESAKDVLNANDTSKIKTAIEEGIALVTKRMKLIKIGPPFKSTFRTNWHLTRRTRRGYFARRGEQRRKLKRRRRSEEEALSEVSESEISALSAVQPSPPFFLTNFGYEFKYRKSFWP